MDCIIRVQESEDGARILLPFEIGDGSIMSVRDVNNGVKRLNLMYPEKWDELKSRMSGYELRHLGYGHGVANLDSVSRQFEVKDHCMWIDADSLAYLGADFVRVMPYGNGTNKGIRIEPYAASKNRREAERNAA